MKRKDQKQGVGLFSFAFFYFFFGSMVLSTSLLKRKLIYTLSCSVLFGIMTEKSKNRDWEAKKVNPKLCPGKNNLL